jgi:hypothetical protein
MFRVWQRTGVFWIVPEAVSPAATGRQAKVALAGAVWATAIEGSPSAAAIAAVRMSLVMVLAPYKVKRDTLSLPTS